MQKFNIGDVVNYVNKTDTSWKVGQTHVIHEVYYRGQGEFEYSTTRGAWFHENDFELVRKADKKSLKQLDKLVLEDE
jgi:hypothetical protein